MVPKFETVKGEVEKAWYLERAGELARQKAEELEKKTSFTRGDLAQLKDLAAEQKLPQPIDLPAVARRVAAPNPNGEISHSLQRRHNPCGQNSQRSADQGIAGPAAGARRNQAIRYFSMMFPGRHITWQSSSNEWSQGWKTFTRRMPREIRSPTEITLPQRIRERAVARLCRGAKLCRRLKKLAGRPAPRMSKAITRSARKRGSCLANGEKARRNKWGQLTKKGDWLIFAPLH